MDPRIESYLANADLFTAVVDDLEDWDAPSPCEGWRAVDVLDHVLDTQRDFLAQRGLDLGARPTGEPATAWRAHLDAVRPAVADDELVGAEYDGHFGRTTLADTLASFYGFDMRVHRWDLAHAAGREMVFSDSELDQIDAALDGFGEAIYREAVCKPALDAPTDASRQTRILARMGRQA